MGKLMFIFKRLKKLNSKAMKETAKKIAKKTKKTYLLILLDMINCGIKYQAGYNDYLEFEFYNLNNKQRKTYLTAGINNSIIKKYNDKAYWHLFDDKVEFNKLFEKYLCREWIDLRNASQQEFELFVNKHNIIIVKPLDDCGGNGVERIDTNEFKNVNLLYETLKDKKQYLVEEYVVQNKDMMKLYEHSVNTLRLFTFYDGKSYYLQGILKIGNGGNIDNFSNGGMYTFVDDKGVVIAPAIDKADLRYDAHPISKTKIIGFKVPMFNQAKKLVLDAAKLVPEVKYVGWDVALTDKGALIIEGNCYPGVFQIKPSLSKNKEGILPAYLKYMKI